MMPFSGLRMQPMPLDGDNKTTHFGFRKINAEEKSNLVADVFRSVAPKYDVMNDLMSFGLHRLWKRFTLDEASLRPGQTVLDVASGTGDLAKSFAKIVGKRGKVIMTDINEAMLNTGRDRLADAGVVGNVDYVQADAEQLPFADNYFDCVTIAFGLRNVTNKAAALRSLYRVLKPGGKLLILEFSHPTVPIVNQFYDLYSFNVIPKLGEWVANDRTSYQYLVESIRMHPDQETLKAMMLESGLEEVTYFNLSGGIVALHKGYKY
jgi:demethylmenaquinone methyltransferase / 2-methoxy-6-polyprenyl-1,4-benzoquinol methylase